MSGEELAVQGHDMEVGEVKAGSELRKRRWRRRCCRSGLGHGGAVRRGKLLW